jgi:hypothetical protein
MYCSVRSFRSRLHLDGYATMPLIKAYMRWIDSCNHNIFSICLSCLREHNFFLNEKEWLILQKKNKSFLRGTNRN